MLCGHALIAHFFCDMDVTNTLYGQKHNLQMRLVSISQRASLLLFSRKCHLSHRKSIFWPMNIIFTNSNKVSGDDILQSTPCFSFFFQLRWQKYYIRFQLLYLVLQCIHCIHQAPVTTTNEKCQIQKNTKIKNSCELQNNINQRKTTKGR